MNKINLAEQLRSDHIREDCERMHPELHEAVRRFWGRANLGEMNGNGIHIISPCDMHSAESQQEFLEARQAFRARNADRIHELTSELQAIEAEMAQLKPAVDRLQQCRWQNECIQRDSWKAIAKRLGIHRYLTDNGQISTAKLKRGVKGDRAAAQRVLETYNQYVREVNAEEQARQYHQVTEQDRAQGHRYNQLCDPVNALRRQINLLSGNLKPDAA